MNTTTIGLHFKKFYADPKVWGEHDSNGWYVEDLVLTVNGEGDMDTLYGLYGDNFENLPDNAVVEIENGDILWQGRGVEPARADGGDIRKAFNAWLESQTRITLVATLNLPKDMDPQRLARIVGVLTALGAELQGAEGVDAPTNEQSTRIQEAVAGLLDPVGRAPRAPKP